MTAVKEAVFLGKAAMKEHPWEVGATWVHRTWWGGGALLWERQTDRQTDKSQLPELQPAGEEK